MATTFDPATYTARHTYDDIGPRYQEAFDRVPGQVRSLKWIIGQMPKGAKVVDAGCGAGIPACSMLAEAGFDVTGVDITPRMIEASRSQVPNAKFEVADIREWEPAGGDGSLDGVTSYFALLAAVSQADIRGFFKKANRWLQPKGCFVLGTLAMDLDFKVVQWMGRDTVVSSLKLEDLLDALRAAGFEVEKHETVKFMPKSAEVGLCKPEEAWEETHTYFYCRKS